MTNISIPMGTIGAPVPNDLPSDDELNELRIAEAERLGWPRVDIVEQHRRYLVDADGNRYRLRTSLAFERGKKTAGFVHADDRPPYTVIDGSIVVLEAVRT